ncbi:MAG TPA: hypothetical protein ENH08_03000 [Chromatiales bacterium]|nr:hypothetical protein [Chromatiales bacterium]
MHFDMDPYAMRELLGVWLRKGRIRRMPVADTGACGGGGSCGGGCSGCAVPGPESEHYTWAAPAGDPPEK